MAAFYSPISRLWEFLVGAFLASSSFDRNIHINDGIQNYQQPFLKGLGNIRYIFSAAGSVLIALGLFVITRNRHFPGAWALLPVIGAALVISGGPDSPLNARLFGSRPLVWLGQISYPLYLWHWPMLSVLRMTYGRTPPWEARGAMVLGAVFLAWLTYRIVESRLRFPRLERRTLVTTALVTSMAGIGAAGGAIYLNNGIPQRLFAKKYLSYTESIARPNLVGSCFDVPYSFRTRGKWFCSFGQHGKGGTDFAYGDSHALSMVPALQEIAKKVSAEILFTGNSGCPPLLGVQALRGEKAEKEHNCRLLNARIFRYVRDNHIHTVVLIARWSYYLGGTIAPDEIQKISMSSATHVTREYSRESFEFGLKETLREYNKIGVKVVVVEDNPEQKIDPDDALREAIFYEKPVNSFSVTALENYENQSLADKYFMAQAKGVYRLVDLTSAFCRSGSCPLERGGKFLYFDKNHLSIEGALRAYPLLSAAMTGTSTEAGKNSNRAGPG